MLREGRDGVKARRKAGASSGPRGGGGRTGSSARRGAARRAGPGSLRPRRAASGEAGAVEVVRGAALEVSTARAAPARGFVRGGADLYCAPLAPDGWAVTQRGRRVREHRCAAGRV